MIFETSRVCLGVQKVLSHISAISPEKKIFFRVFLDFCIFFFSRYTMGTSVFVSFKIYKKRKHNLCFSDDCDSLQCIENFLNIIFSEITHPCDFARKKFFFLGFFGLLEIFFFALHHGKNLS